LDVPILERRDPHAVFASESVVEVLRHLQTEGRDAVPVLSESGTHLVGWATGRSIARAVAERLAIPPAARRAGDTTDLTEPDPGRSTLPGRHVIEVAVGEELAGQAIEELAWPSGYVPVSVTRDGRYREALPGLRVRDGDVLGLIAHG
jgi:CBS domain-containing protein